MSENSDAIVIIDKGNTEGEALDEDAFDESQRLETQPPPDIPAMTSRASVTPRIVSADWQMNWELTGIL